jgi:hypothetical protein
VDDFGIAAIVRFAELRDHFRGFEIVVCVEVLHPLAGRVSEHEIARVVRALAPGLDDFDAVAEASRDIQRVIRGAVVHDDDFDFHVALIECALDGLRDPAHCVEAGDADGDFHRRIVRRHVS